MVRGWRTGLPGKRFRPKIVKTKIEMSLAGASNLYLIDVNEGDKIVVQYAFSHCVRWKKPSKHHFSPLEWSMRNVIEQFIAANMKERRSVPLLANWK